MRASGMQRESEDSDRTFDERRHVREDELALRWRISLRTLQRWRRQGRVAGHLALGRRVVYRRSDVEAFERRHLQVGESQ